MSARKRLALIESNAIEIFSLRRIATKDRDKVDCEMFLNDEK